MNREDSERTFKPKNFRRIYGSCKGETLTDKGVKKHWQCPGCGMWSKKERCPACDTERGK